jgi:uncharacterized protein involved in type VI secretion and phage assembly
MNLSDLLIDEDRRGALTARIPGVVVAIVTNTQDQDGLGRVKVRFPWLSDADESPWVRVASLMAGKDRGAYFLPEVDDEVLVAFEHGDMRLPFVIGALWNGKDTPPAKNDDGKNNVRMIKSRSGHLVKLDDTDGKEQISIIDKTGKNSILIDSSANSIVITSDKDITLSATNGTITLNAQKLTLKSSADSKIDAGGGADITASGTLNVKGATVNIN